MRNLGINSVYAKTRGIVVSGTGQAGNSTLEHIWALILATVRYVAIEDANVKARNPQWQTFIPLALSGHTLGLVGVGNLGSKTAQVGLTYYFIRIILIRFIKIAKAFGMRVIGWSPNLTPEKAKAAGVEFISSKEELFRQSDIVSLHIVLSESTRHIITAEDLALLKPTAFFINTSRGPLVDEDALIDTLQQGRIAGAGLDVFDIEPLPLDHPLRTLKNVTLSPHLGYVADTGYEVSSVATIRYFMFKKVRNRGSGKKLWKT